MQRPSRKLSLKECYEILKIDKHADLETLKSAYRKRAFELHPDLHPDNPDAGRQFQRLNEAYVALSAVLKPAAEKAAQGKGCIVHEGKPSICKAWPFFRGNIEDAESLALAKDFCPGINPDISHEDFAREGMAYLEQERLLASDTRTEANALILPRRQ